jgi:hypothetical protein
MLAGLLLLLTLPISLPWRGLAAAAWLAQNTCQLRVIANGYTRCRRIRIDQTGAVAAQGPDGCWFPATLVTGSVVLAGFAWLRFKADDGQQFVELLSAKRAGNEGWRRLQVIWRHIGAGR